MEKTFLEADFNRALVEIVISANVPYPLTQNLRFGFLCLIQIFQKRSQTNFYGFCKNRFPIWVATQNNFFKTDWFRQHPKRLLSPKPIFSVSENRTFCLKPV